MTSLRGQSSGTSGNVGSIVCEISVSEGRIVTVTYRLTAVHLQ